MPDFYPGFEVGGVGAGIHIDSDTKPNYNYTWQIAQLLGGTVDSGSPLIFAKDCTLPTFSATKETVEGSVEYKYASVVRWDDIKIRFYDIPAYGYKLVDLMRQWRKSIWSSDAGLQPANSISGGSGYKKQSQIKVYNLDWTDYYTWTLYGCWPQTIREGDLTYTSSDIKTVEVVLCYDWAETS